MENLILPVIVLALFYVMFIRPNQRRERSKRDLMSSMSLGDEVVTIGGIIGRVADVGDEFVSLELQPGTVIRVVKRAISHKVPESEPGSEIPEEESKE